MAKDYYQILGVNRNAGPDEIKTAFRKLAHQHHPDKSNGNAEKFKQINEAYQVLGNAEKRKQYDQFGSAFDQAGMGGFGGQGFNWSDFARQGNGGFGAGGFQSAGFDFSDLGDILGDFLGGQARSGFGGRAREARGADLETNITISFEEMVFGAEKNISLRKQVACEHCRASGAEPGTKIDKCKTCGGSGQVTVSRDTFLGSFRSVADCSDCNGTGKKPEKYCSRCGGGGIVSGTEEFKIKIPAGMENNGVLKMTGKGEPGVKGNRAGDLYVRVSILQGSDLKRIGDDLISEIEINFSQAVLGDKIYLRTLDGEIVLKVPVGTVSGQKFVIKGKGVGRLRGRGRGDLIVKVKVNVPKDLNREQKKLIEELKKEGL